MRVYVSLLQVHTLTCVCFASEWVSNASVLHNAQQTHMQCQRCPVNGKPLKLSAIQTGRKLIAEEGPLRLFRGVSTMLSASLPAHAVYFSVFEAMKKSLGADSAEHTPVASGTFPLLLFTLCC